MTKRDILGMEIEFTESYHTWLLGSGSVYLCVLISQNLFPIKCFSFFFSLLPRLIISCLDLQISFSLASHQFLTPSLPNVIAKSILLTCCSNFLNFHSTLLSSYLSTSSQPACSSSSSFLQPPSHILSIFRLLVLYLLWHL